MDLKKLHQNLSKVDLLTVDLGNSNPHVGLFDKGELKSVTSLGTLSDSDFSLWLNKQEKPVSICSVRKSISSSFSKAIEEKTFHDMPVHYANTLGHDRLICAYFLFHTLKKPTIFADAGTFLTIDYINENGFQGGEIHPGLKTFSQSYKRGSNLEPFIETDFEIQAKDSWPSTSEEAIKSGVLAYRSSLQARIKELVNEKPMKSLVLSGGEAKSLFPKQDEDHFEPHLIHHAMYFQYVKHEI